MSKDWGNVYKEIGVQPVINATGSVTLLGGSSPAPEVRMAMAAADSVYVSMMELQEKAGEHIAKMVDVPSAYITSGAGSALTLATAAIMAGSDTNKIEQLPDTTGMKSEILIQHRQRYNMRYWYDRCLELAGAKLVDFGNDQCTTKQDLENAINANTAAVHYYMVEQSPDEKSLSLKDTIEIAHSHNIPVTVDSAGQIFPLDNIGKYVRMGADFQCVAVSVDYKITGLSSEDVVNILKNGNPPIWTRVKESENFITIHMFGLNDGEEHIVANRIAEIFSEK